MEKKLGVVTLEQLGQPPTHPNRPRRDPQPTQREENPLQGSTNQPDRHLRQDLPADQDPEQKLQDDLRRCREYCEEQELEVVIEYSDPKGSWKEFRQMMTVATGRRPPFDNIVVSNFDTRFAPYPGTTWTATGASGRTASPSGQYHQVHEPSRQPPAAAQPRKGEARQTPGFLLPKINRGGPLAPAQAISPRGQSTAQKANPVWPHRTMLWNATPRHNNRRMPQ